jgi:hypothetical protein
VIDLYTGLGPSSSSVVSGSVPVFLRRLAPSLELTYLALEFGTRPIAEVLAALHADAWLHALPDRPTPHREAILRQVREAFLIDSPAWRDRDRRDGVLREGLQAHVPMAPTLSAPSLAWIEATPALVKLLPS